MSPLLACLFGFATLSPQVDDDVAGLRLGVLVDEGVEPAGRFVGTTPRALSKKHAWLDDKKLRSPTRVDQATLDRNFAQARRLAAAGGRARTVAAVTPTALPAPGMRVEPLTTLYNLHTREALPLVPGLPLETPFHRFLRDHYTNQATTMDVRLIDVLRRAAARFGAERIEVVSGYRSPKYNLSLRKKGREVARSSQHCEGRAVDFRIRGVDTRTLLKFVRSLRRGGVGYYPHSQFVHCDTGPIRFWKGS